mmetsp:Transcript_19043/g.19325  ORF Transcript_19043/g.19325 Transcript_19043/m.19325 type:complete len:110 (-) Transcript_19043:9-338(-)
MPVQWRRIVGCLEVLGAVLLRGHLYRPGQRSRTQIFDGARPTRHGFVFFVNGMGTMNQWHMASSKHHPLLLHFLGFVKRSLYKAQATDNVMVNNPITRTGPGVVQINHF